MRVVAATLLIAAYLLLCLAIVWRRRRRLQLGHAPSPGLDSDAIWVLHASQTGTAEALAQQAAAALAKLPLSARVAPLAQLTSAQWQTATRVLLVVATYGEGDAPDAAARFASATMVLQPDLRGLRFGLLALGDSSFQHFCGFGRAVQRWLLERGAQPWFDAVEADRCSQVALAQWRERLGAAVGGAIASQDMCVTCPAALSLRVRERRVLNPLSALPKLVLLRCEATQHCAAAWQAGDLLKVAPPTQPHQWRDYSIASVPASGTLDLLVREQAATAERPALCSRWLTRELDIGEILQARMCAQSGFRLGDHAGRPLLLIGNGSGLAGLRSHLQALALRRDADASEPGAWLVYGERDAACDRPCADELAAWRAGGVLARLDLLFSRSAAPGEARYVQHRLLEAADELRCWVERGAAIYVCGSLHGMAEGVQAALRSVLGEAGLAELITQGRLRRDVY